MTRKVDMNCSQEAVIPYNYDKVTSGSGMINDNHMTYIMVTEENFKQYLSETSVRQNWSYTLYIFYNYDQYNIYFVQTSMAYQASLLKLWTN